MVQDPPVTAASSILATYSARYALPSFLPTIARPCPSESRSINRFKWTFLALSKGESDSRRILLLVFMLYSLVKSLGMSESGMARLRHSPSSSARVMRNENGDSRGFGFVSFQTPDQGSVGTVFSRISFS